MICEEVFDSLHAYIQKEADGDERIHIFKHLQNCSNCRDSYLEQLKIYYTIERDKVLTVPPVIKHNFKQNILDSIDSEDIVKFRFQKGWIWYAAAAVLIIGVIIGRYAIPTMEVKDSSSLTTPGSISYLLENEDWTRLQTILSDEEEFSKYAGEELDVQHLLEKLIKLENFAQTIPRIRILSGSSSVSGVAKRISPVIEISIKDFIDLLEQIKHRRNEITLQEVSAILVDI